jgi:hypothetical protein
MARKKQGHTDHFDLLPFIAILMCVLGSLLLVELSIAAMSLGPAAKEAWNVPSTYQTSKQAVLAEWDGRSVTMHQEAAKTTVPWTRETPSEEWQALLNRLAAQRDTHYVLFAIRPSGFGSFNRMAREFRERGIEVGYEPIGQGRRVSLSDTKKVVAE